MRWAFFLIALTCASRLSRLESAVSQGSLLSMTEQDYDTFVSKGPREYHVVLLCAPYRNPEYQPVLKVIDVLSTLATSYEMHLQSQRGTSPKTPRAVVFAVVDTEQSPNVLPRHGLDGPVSLITLPPLTHSNEPTKVEKSQLYLFRSSWSQKDIHAWIVARTQVEFPPGHSDDNLFLVIACFLSLAVSLIKYLFPGALHPSNPILWLGLCVLVWLCVMSGMHYCVRHGAPPVGVGPQRSMVFFHPDPTNQYALEGIFVTFGQMLVAILLVTLCDVFPDAPGSPRQKRRNGFVLLALTTGLVYLLNKAFFIKYHFV
eukprot:c10948_g1_i1.p1 GENE.c10948_g1_i1~~c10948_g1_i1.p1  ORF type:complete len:315 (-),score=37.95 c10948_g1_i1:28-972(-)